MAIQSLRTDGCIDDVLDRYSAMVYRLALAQVRAKHDAEDIFQDVFLYYISKPRTFESEEHRKAWLIRVTINHCRKLWASAWFRRTEPLDEAMVFETPEQTDLFAYLALLPPKYRAVIHLFYQEGFSVRQISQTLNAKESTVRAWLTRARAILSEKLKGGFPDE